MNKKLIGFVVAILIIGGIALFMTQNNSDNTSSTTTQSTSQTSNSSNSSSSQETASANTITYNGTSFSPSTLTVTAGSKVTVKNTSTVPVLFSSDPHPQHTDDPELNMDTINPGQSQTITVTTIGTHGYHNHFDQSQTGTIVVN